MSGTITPIETRYKGYAFRSRLEARWAVFFETMGVQWDYEVQGYDLGRSGQPGDQVSYGLYLPDFELAHKIFVEIKPKFDPPLSRENEDAFIAAGMVDALVQVPRLAEMSGRPALLIEGSPWPDDYRVWLFESSFPDEVGPIWQFADCRRCDGLWLTYRDGEGGASLVCTCGEHWKEPITHGRRVMRAFEAARKARFDSVQP
jgi:hypothetical protein